MDAWLRYRGRGGNVVLDPAQPPSLQVLAGFTARLAGAYLSPEAGWRGQLAGVPVGVKFVDGKRMARHRDVAWTEGIDDDFPDLDLVWQAFARWRDTKFKRVSPKDLKAEFRQQIEQNRRARPWARKRLLMTDAELAGLPRKSRERYPGLFNTWPALLEFVGDVEADAICPGNW